MAEERERYVEEFPVKKMGVPAKETKYSYRNEEWSDRLNLPNKADRRMVWSPT